MRLLTLTLLLLVAPTAPAHPLPNLRFDRTVQVKVESTGVVVKYALELNEWTMAIDGNRLLTAADVAGVTGGRAYANKYGARKAVFIADNLRAEFAGKPLVFKVRSIDLEADSDHPRFRFTFRAERPGDAVGRFTFEDQNFENVVGRISLTLEEAGERFELSDIVEPADLRGKASLQYKFGDDERARRVEATIASTVPPPLPPVVVAEAQTEPSKPDEPQLSLGSTVLFVAVGIVAVVLMARFVVSRWNSLAAPATVSPNS